MRRTLVTLLLLGAGLACRLYRLDEVPHDFHSLRQYQFANTTRGLYVKYFAPDHPLRAPALANLANEVKAEPPLLEYASAGLYRLLGGEHFAAPRCINILLWILTAPLVFAVARRFSGTVGGWVGMGFFLFLPYGVEASRSCQPDPLMLLLLTTSLLATLRWQEAPDRRRFILAILAAAAAALAKPQAVFIPFAFFAAACLPALRAQPARTVRTGLTFAFCAILPALLYYGVYGALVNRFMQGHAQNSFAPELWRTVYFWKGWLGRVLDVVSVPGLLLGLAGFLALPAGRLALLSAGLGFGYLAFGLAFSYHCATHDYYHLQILPLLAIGLGVVGQLVWDAASRADALQRLRQVLLVGVAAAWAGLTVLLSPWRVTPPPAAITYEDIAWEIGEKIGHSTRTVVLEYDYGKPLFYFGWISGAAWPESATIFRVEALRGHAVETARERFQRIYAPAQPEFFVIRRLHEYYQQKDLVEFLESTYPVLARSEHYLIFDLRTRLAPSP